MLFIQIMIADCLHATNVIDFKVIPLELCLRRFKLNTEGCRKRKSEEVA